MALLLCCIVTLGLYGALFTSTAAAQLQQFANGSSSFMRLDSLGPNLSPHLSSNELSSRKVMRGLLDTGFHFSILTSPSFDNTSPPSSGFSLGFYRVGNGCDRSAYACDWYMAVCAGHSSGLVVPVWLANSDRVIKGNPSLVLVEMAVGSNLVKELQLRDADGVVVWNVSNVAVMEMSDSGDFRIYNSAMVPVFQSHNNADILAERQMLSVGMQLTSNNSAYSARVEKGGLALYLNSLGDHAPPYWIFPFMSNPYFNTSYPRIDQMLNSSPPSCSNHPPYISLLTANRGSHQVLECAFESGSCSSYRYEYHFRYPSNYNVSWSFLRLENDGKLYIYAVSAVGSTILNRQAFDSITLGHILYYDAEKNVDEIQDVHIVGIMQNLGPLLCDVPLGCGPLAICTPYTQTTCVCPDDSSFEPIDRTDVTQGCKHRTKPPRCRGSNNKLSTTTFVEFKSIANIFLLNGWTLNTTHDVDACKQACSLDCSCRGISYQFSTSFCFLITQDISLLNVTYQFLSILNFTAAYHTVHKNSTSLWSAMHDFIPISANDYVTHLKITPKSKPNRFLLKTLLGIIPFCVVVGFLLGQGAYHLRRRKRKRLHRAKEDEELRDILPLLPTRFSYKELHKATKGFRNLLGIGRCGSVYEGTLLDGRKVAVKVLEGVLQGASQAKEALAEIATVGRTRHQNIIHLVGFCWQMSHRMLVYEYEERGSLDRWLFRAEGVTSVLDWQKRYSVALGVARGLHYLHDLCEQPILHFDIKPENILLSDEFEAKISDFGMSRLLQKDMSSLMTGTPGYIAPEWFSQGIVSKKSDMYSLGIVMLEIVAGRKVLEGSLLKTAQKNWEQGCLMDMVDPRLHEMESGFDEEQAQRLLYTALWCIQQDPALRPHAAMVVEWLESSNPIQQPPHVSNSTTPVLH